MLSIQLENLLKKMRQIKLIGKLLQCWPLMCIVEAEVYPDVRQVEIPLGKVYLQQCQSPEGR